MHLTKHLPNLVEYHVAAVSQRSIDATDNQPENQRGPSVRRNAIKVNLYHGAYCGWAIHRKTDISRLNRNRENSHYGSATMAGAAARGTFTSGGSGRFSFSFKRSGWLGTTPR